MSKSDKLAVCLAAGAVAVGFLVGGPAWGFVFALICVIFLVMFLRHEDGIGEQSIGDGLRAAAMTRMVLPTMSEASNLTFEKVVHGVEKDDTLPRPKITLGWILSGRPAFGLPVTLAHIAFTNVGQESAHKVCIVPPDKSQKYWIEQVAPIDLIVADGKPVFPALLAMHRVQGQASLLQQSDDPIRLIRGVMMFDNVEPEMLIAVEYYTFGKRRRYLTTYKVEFDSGNPSVDCVSDE